jgi:hypothetical protein
MLMGEDGGGGLLGGSGFAAFGPPPCFVIEYFLSKTIMCERW